MRLQGRLDDAMVMGWGTSTVIDADAGTEGIKAQVKIPRHEQDEDRWRHGVPGRDPVTQMKGV